MSPSEEDKAEERKQDETIVLWEFRNAFQNVHEQLLDNPAYQDLLSDEEHTAITNVYKDPTWYCLGAGIATMGLLRAGRSFRRYRQMRYPNNHNNNTGISGGYRLDPPFPPNPNMAQPPPPPIQPPPPPIFTWKTALVDVTLATMAGAVTGTTMADMDEANSNLPEIALQPGRSNICNAFCPAIVEEYEYHWQQIRQMEDDNIHNNSFGMQQPDLNNNNNTQNNNSTATLLNLGVVAVQIQSSQDPIPADIHKDILQNPQNPHLQAYIQWAKNCQARQNLERRLRKNWNLPETAPVSIPEPGVVVSEEDDEEDYDEEEEDVKET